MNKLIELYKKYREIITYLIVGGLTTLLYMVIYWVFRILGVNVAISTCIAWIGGVLFAFFANKFVVFQSKDKSNYWDEFIKFIAFRIASLLIDLAVKFIMMDLLRISEFITVLVAQIVVIVANYVFSKFFIFIKKK